MCKHHKPCFVEEETGAGIGAGVMAMKDTGPYEGQ